MEYKFKSINESEQVERVDSDINLLVEQDSVIKKMNIDQIPQNKVQPDWEETNESSLAFIKNKPNLEEVGGGSKITYFTSSSGYFNELLKEDGTIATIQDIYDALKAGTVRLTYSEGSYIYNSDVIKYIYGQGSGFYFLELYFNILWSSNTDLIHITLTGDTLEV